MMQSCPGCKYAAKDHISICPICGTIINEDLKIKGDERNVSSDKSMFTLLSGALILLLCCYMGYVDSTHKETFENRQVKNSAELNIAVITNDNVKSIAISPHSAYSKVRTSCLAKPYRDEFIKITSKMPLAQYLGMHMNYYRSIDIDAGDAGKFDLYITTRGQEVTAKFRRYDDRDGTVAVDYDAVELYEWLENLPGNALQDCSAGISK